MHFGLDREILRSEQGVGGRVQEPGEVVVGRIGIPLLAPHRKTVHVGAYGYKAGGLDDHRLIEVAGREGFAQSPVLCNDQAVKLHIAAGGCPRSGFQHVAQDVAGNRCGTVFTNRSMLEEHAFHGL